MKYNFKGKSFLKLLDFTSQEIEYMIEYSAKLKEMKKKGYDNKTIASKAGIPPFTVGKYAAQASKFKSKDLKQALTECVEADEAVKTGRMNDKMSVELLIVKYSAMQ